MTSKSEQLQRELEKERIAEESKLLADIVRDNRSDPLQPRSALPQSGARITEHRRTANGWIDATPLTAYGAPHPKSMWKR